MKYLLLFLLILILFCLIINYLNFSINLIEQDPLIISRLYSLSNYDCKRYDFKGIRFDNNSELTPPIYDFFLFHDELDLLEIRLYELYNYVTLFLIVESNITLSGKPKILYLKNNWNKFKKYHKKMRRFQIELDQNPIDQWSNEIKSRDEGLQLALKEQKTDILLLTSDIDEIPKGYFINLLLNCELPKPFPSLVLICAYYYYSFEYRRQGGTTIGPTVTYLKLNQTKYLSGKKLRDERFNYQEMPSSCYHCSWCFNEINLIRSKINSFSHIELNRKEFQSQQYILDHYRYGIDLFNRPSEKYIHLKSNDEIPQLIKEQSQRFAYMINRSTLTNLGFIDLI